MRGTLELPVVLSCEHASGFIPPAYGDLGMTHAHLEECARGRDVGAAELFDYLVRNLACCGVKNGISRLVVDTNRYADQDGIVPASWGGKRIGGNVDLSAAEIADRVETFHRPYHAALQERFVEHERRHGRVHYFSIHAMAPTFEGQVRSMDFSLIANRGVSCAEGLAKRLRESGYDAVVNEPYSLDRDIVRAPEGDPMERFNERAVIVEMNERLDGDAGAREALLEAIRDVIESAE